MNRFFSFFCRVLQFEHHQFSILPPRGVPRGSILLVDLLLLPENVDGRSTTCFQTREYDDVRGDENKSKNLAACRTHKIEDTFHGDLRSRLPTARLFFTAEEFNTLSSPGICVWSGKLFIKKQLASQASH